LKFNNPFERRGRWFRGNLHTHTTESDGRLSPQETVEFYKSRGYDFICLTDHNKVTDPSGLSTDDFLVFTGCEVSPAQTSHHIVGIGIKTLGPVEKEDTPQDMIDRLGTMGGLVFVAHPYWSALDSGAVRNLTGIIGIELYNTGCEVEIGRGFSTVHWDVLLTSGMALDGLAVDDGHRYTDDAPGGWVWVKAPRLTEDSIMAAISRGHFYSSTGPTVQEATVNEEEIRVACSPAETISFHCHGPSGGSVHRVGEAVLTHASYGLRPELRYLRVECIDAGGRKAWLNPLYTDLFGE
jgi:hypothetical protein